MNRQSIAQTESGDISISVSSETECFWSFPRTEPANSWDILIQDKIGDVILLTSQDNAAFSTDHRRAITQH